MKSIKIAIVDDQNLFRQTLGMLVRSVPEFELVAEAESGRSLLDIFAKLEVLPDILLMDMSMPGMDGIELSKEINLRFPKVKIIVLSVHAQERLIATMISAGASAYLIKNCDKEELIFAIKTTDATGFYINRSTLLAIQDAARQRNKTIKQLENTPSELTAREKEVLLLICKEKSSSEIAEILFLSARTVEGHRNNLLLKTESRNTAGLVLFAIRHQLVQPL